MRIRLILIFLGIVLLGGSGCGVMNEVTDEQEDSPSEDTLLNELSENKRVEYQFKFIEAVKLRLMGNNSEALEYLTQCSEIKPSSPDPYYQKSLIASQIDEYQQAINFGKKAVEYAPDNKWYRTNLAELYLRQEEHDSSRIQYEYLVEELDVNELDVLFKLAQLYQKTDNFQKALEYYNTVEERVDLNERVSQLKKSIYVKIGEKEKAVNEVKKLIEHFPDKSQYYGELAELYATFNEYDKAKEMYDRLFELDSTNKLGQMSLVRYYNEKGQPDKALETYESKVIPHKSIDFRNKMLIFMDFLQDPKQLSKNLDQFKQSLDTLSSYYPKKMEVEALYADLYLKTNNYREAADHLKTLATSSQNKYIYWDQLLSIYSYLGEFEKMFQYGRKAIKTYDNKPRIFLLTGIGALQTDKPEKAVTLLEEGLQHIQDNRSLKVQFYTQLGEAYHKTEDYEQSDQYFKKVLELDPDNKVVLNNYSYYLSQRDEKLEKALDYTTRIIRDEPDNPIYLDTYAWILFKMGKYEKAKKFIEKAMENGGDDDAEILEHYGDILYKTGNEEKALQIWKQSKNMGNQSEQLNYKLENESLPSNTEKD
ncbi:MAG: tetratricopeptide repeat protein [Bacteroidota bacterium]